LARTKKQLPVLEEVEISGVAAEGKAFARVNDRVVFVPFVAPGDVVDIQLTRKQSNCAEGRAIRFHRYSPDRVQPFCTHFGTCGGCKWQHLAYEDQLRYKQAQVTDSLTRIGKLAVGETLPIIASAQTRYYRNKLEFTFSNKRWLTAEQMPAQADATDMNGLGFHIPGMFDKVLDIETCYLQDDLSNHIRRSIKTYCLAHEGYSFFDLRRQEGFMRTLIIRTSHATGEVMVILVFFHDDRPRREALLTHLAESFPRITSLLYIINDKCNDTITDRDVHVFRGKDHITEEMEGLRFRIGAKSFYQTNSAQACELYKAVRDLAALRGDELVYDLYTGAGTIAHFLSRRAVRVVGIEYVPEAITDARLNARLNGIDNTLFFAGDMKDILTADFIRNQGRPEIIITDPPRAGMHPGVVDAILAAAPARIVYVSCNPATQARDLALLARQYALQRIQPVDMFPHTHHVENVALLIRSDAISQ
jgi:23S rRNA (uracil1939-C5)-methyltransferase